MRYAIVMKILAIDTSTPVGSVALAEGALLKAQDILNISATHNQRLLPGIDRILKNTGWTLGDLDALAVSLGPGSFTGLRIGMSVAKGLAWATGKPLAGVPTLDALAANVPLVPYPVCPVLDARKGEIYTALYRQGEDQLQERFTPYMTLKPAKLLDLISEKTVFVGDALLSYGEYLADKLDDRLLRVPPHLNVVQASSVAWLALEMLGQGRQENVSSCTPLYVRPSEAELNRTSK
jgi:tRNA threonylcarbamoyladenosine biosynthesis protein TsaB